MGVASTAPAYSLAATLGFIVAVVGTGAPLVALLAFVPMLLPSIGYSELNKADPDRGTTFTWAARAFGPRTGWAGGWAIVAADILVMTRMSQVAGQYVFLLVGSDGIGSNLTNGWVLHKALPASFAKMHPRYLILPQADPDEEHPTLVPGES